MLIPVQHGLSFYVFNIFAFNNTFYHCNDNTHYTNQSIVLKILPPPDSFIKISMTLAIFQSLGMEINMDQTNQFLEGQTGVDAGRSINVLLGVFFNAE